MYDPNFHTRALISRFNVTAKGNSDFSIKDTVAAQINLGIAKVLGAKYYLGRNWRRHEPLTTLDDIQEILDDKKVPVNAEDLIGKELVVKPGSTSFYYLEQSSGTAGRNPLYTLRYQKDTF